jgi:heme/copper-type cytochrome/quinol oxidase subunit 1
MTVIPMLWLGYAAMPRRVLDYPSVLGGWHAVVSAGHMLSIAGMMAFFIMIFDSIRQARTATRNSFGVTRFNTRLNFYVYEGARTWFIQRKGWVLSRFNFSNSVHLNNLHFSNYEYLETTLYSYVVTRRVN